MRRKFRFGLLLLIALMPSRLKRSLYCHLFGWTIDGSAQIGLAILDVKNVRIGAGARIGHFAVFRNLRYLELGECARIGQWNWCTAAPMFLQDQVAEEAGCLIVGPHSAITLRHYIDCSGGVEVGSFTTIAGVRSTLLTHQIDAHASRQTIAPVRIGDYCFVGSDVRITPGSRIPDRCVVAMGAVVAGELPNSGALYGGVPARKIREIADDDAYFHRTEGFVRA